MHETHFLKRDIDKNVSKGLKKLPNDTIKMVRVILENNSIYFFEVVTLL